jgi:ankyrin repeat protein
MPVNMLRTPLEWACETGSVELVELLMRNLMASKPDALAAYQGVSIGTVETRNSSL